MMRELSVNEIEQVSGGSTNWHGVMTTMGLVGIAISAPVSMPTVTVVAAGGAAATGIWTAYDSWQSSY